MGYKSTELYISFLIIFSSESLSFADKYLFDFDFSGFDAHEAMKIENNTVSYTHLRAHET